MQLGTVFILAAREWGIVRGLVLLVFTGGSHTYRDVCLKPTMDNSVRNRKNLRLGRVLPRLLYKTCHWLSQR